MISFIIPAHNEEKYLPATLRSIRDAMRAVQEPYEIVVADDASTDATAKLAESLGARVAKAGQRKISAARNAGAKAALGDYYFFVDADTWVDAPVIAGALAAMRGAPATTEGDAAKTLAENAPAAPVARPADSAPATADEHKTYGSPAAPGTDAPAAAAAPPSGAVGGGAGARFEGRLPFYAGPLAWAMNAFARRAKLAYGCFLFCRPAAFDAAGGFDETLYAAEEWALSRALAKQGAFVILPDVVITSGRKLRSYSGWEVLKVFAAIGLTGGWSLRKKGAKSLWYGPRRDDPG